VIPKRSKIPSAMDQTQNIDRLLMDLVEETIVADEKLSYGRILEFWYHSTAMR
jgi:hypothetical protein